MEFEEGMKFEANMRFQSSPTSENMVGIGTVTINGCVTIDNARLMKYKNKDGEEKGFLALPQKKAIVNGEEKWEDVVSVASPEARRRLYEAAVASAKENALSSLLDEVEVKKIFVVNNKQLRGFAHVRISGVLDIRDIRIYENKDHKLFAAMPRVQRGGEWGDVIHFNNKFTSNEVEGAVLRAYEKTIREKSQGGLGKEGAKKAKPPKRAPLSEGEIEALAKEIMDFTVGKAQRGPEELEEKKQGIIKTLKESPQELRQEYEAYKEMFSNRLQSPDENPPHKNAQETRDYLNAVNKTLAQLEKLAGARGGPVKVEKAR